MNGLVIPVNGHPEVVTSPRWGLPELYQVLDCTMVKLVRLRLEVSGQALLMWLDEEGKFRGPNGAARPRNTGATALVADLLAPGDYIAGPALIVAIDDGGGSVDLPLLSILEIGRRLVRAERPALQTRPL